MSDENCPWEEIGYAGNGVSRLTIYWCKCCGAFKRGTEFRNPNAWALDGEQLCQEDSPPQIK